MNGKANAGKALTRREALALAGKLSSALEFGAGDPDTAGMLADLTCDLVNHANGHATWLAA